MRFEFATAARIVFGPGTLAQAGNIARDFGRHAFVVTGRDPRRAARLLGLLAEAKMAATTFAVPGEPTTNDVSRGTALARAAACDCVVGFGGGSALDAAKAIAALLTNGGDLTEYLEVIGRALPLARPGAPCLAIPTTAGTGAEVTRNAVLSASLPRPASSGAPGAAAGSALSRAEGPALSDVEGSHLHRVKVSLRSPHVLPRVALVDPELTFDLPPAITASTGLDALTQLLEPYTSCRAQPLTDALCVDGLRRIARSLRRAFADGRDAAAREDMALASLYGGLALANAGLGAVHGLAGPIGGMFPAPHGAVCAALLPHVMRANLDAVRARATHDTLHRYDEAARVLTGCGDATANGGIGWVESLVAHLGIRPLSAYGVTRADFPAIASAAARSSSMKANPIPLTNDELSGILARAL